MSSPRTGVLLVNLGTPDEPTPAAVRRYLAEFLSDSRVVELPRALWLPLLYLIILPLRSRRVARAYASIWSERGSPLRYFTQDQARTLQQTLGLPVTAAFRYGQPAIETGFDALVAAGCQRIVVLPQYPQYSSTTTTATVWDAITRITGRRRDIPGLVLIRDYHDDPGWIAALAASVRRHWAEHGRGDRLLMSFHGLPARNVELGDPYADQCRRSAELLASALDLQDGDWQYSFQSRFGPAPWLQPYTDQVLRELPPQGCRRVDVICPGFAADCLETLEEIRLQGQEQFAAAGGDQLRYIPALNADAAFSEALAALVRRESGLEPL